MMNFWTRKDVT